MELSVRFFKRLILVVLALLIVIPIGIAISLGVSSAGLLEEKRAVERELADTQRELKEVLSQVDTRPQPDPEQDDGTIDPAAPVPPETLTSEPIAYQELYPELQCTPASERKRLSGTVYLTFDDGPSENTEKILDILDEYEVKATFFVTGQEKSEEARALLRRMTEEGHSIGLRSYSRQYGEVYSSIPNFLTDFKTAYDSVYEMTSIHPRIFRFPGGSVNSYNAGIFQELIAEMLRRGFTFYDWNVTGEEFKNKTASEIRQTVVEGVEAQSRSIVLLHDGAGFEATVQALPGILETLTAEGYSFSAITPEVEPIWFNYNAAA